MTGTCRDNEHRNGRYDTDRSFCGGSFQLYHGQRRHGSYCRCPVQDTYRLVFALFVVKLKSDEFIIGMALNTFAGGLTIYLLRTIFGVQGTFANSGIQPLPTVHIDFLDSIPVLGPLLNDNSVFIYITWAIVFLAWVFSVPDALRLLAPGQQASIRSP